MYRHSARRQQRWRGLDESHFTQSIHGGYLLSSTQGIFGCASSTTPFGRMEGCLVRPRGKPLYSRHAKVPHEEQIHFTPEESRGGLCTSRVCLPAGGCRCCCGKGSSCTAGVAQRDLWGRRWPVRSRTSRRAAACPTRLIQSFGPEDACLLPGKGTAPSAGHGPLRHHRCRTAPLPDHPAKASRCALASARAGPAAGGSLRLQAVSPVAGAGAPPFPPSP